ncbi:hypothetical protein DTO217A2_4372 [Paecilomyces variotii]|nr:hypothetical protein DTO217A2_4372 [Paecilomyces variotii]KAJ9394135.1 hypothetical protein DTO282F9_8944 [Paecilomyces variotii]
MAFRPTVVVGSFFPYPSSPPLSSSSASSSSLSTIRHGFSSIGFPSVPFHPSRRNHARTSPVSAGQDRLLLTDRPICSSRRFALAWSPSSAAVACCVSIQSTLGKAACDSLRLIGDNNLLTLYPQLAHRAAPRDPKTRRRDPHFPKGAYISSVCLSPSLTGSADDEGALVAI